MTEDVLSKKHRKMFRVYDADGNGFIEKVDFTIIFERVAAVMGLLPGAAEYEPLRKQFLFVWENIRSLADANGDDKVSEEEWLRYSHRMSQSPVLYERDAGALSELMFNLFDADKDGRLTLDDFRRFFRAFRIDEALAAGTWDKLGQKAPGFLTRAEGLVYAKQFYGSNDAADCGNYLLGPL
jgi:Ca2+-binding EF-hand superfamily protein